MLILLHRMNTIEYIISIDFIAVQKRDLKSEIILYYLNGFW